MDEVRRIIEDAGIAVMATCVDGQPRCRPLAFVMMEDGKLWSSTHFVSGKCQELRDNPRVALCFTDSRKYHVRIEGVCELSDDVEKKTRLREVSPRAGRHFPDVNNPDFAHIEVTPTRIRWTEPGFGEYHDVPVRSE